MAGGFFFCIRASFHDKFFGDDTASAKSHEVLPAPAPPQEIGYSHSERREVRVSPMGKGQHEELEAALSEHIEAIFERVPALCGFSIAERLVSESAEDQAREWELYVCAVAAYPQLSDGQAQDFIGEISGALADLLKQRPQAADLLPGRTFARKWH
jgi:hypothetical protein